MLTVLKVIYKAHHPKYCNKYYVEHWVYDS